MSVGVDKITLRNVLRQRRLERPSSWKAERGKQIAERLSTLPELAIAGVLHAFWPTDDEPDIRPVLRAWHARGKTVLLPVVTDFRRDAPPPRVIHRAFCGEQALVKNRWGIHEPSEGSAVSIETAGAIVIPALGVDRGGNRIGHGFGYYDEMLRTVGVPIICPIFEADLVEHVSVDPHDVAVTVIVTESEVIRPSVT